MERDRSSGAASDALKVGRRIGERLLETASSMNSEKAHPTPQPRGPDGRSGAEPSGSACWRIAGAVSGTQVA